MKTPFIFLYIICAFAKGVNVPFVADWKPTMAFGEKAYTPPSVIKHKNFTLTLIGYIKIGSGGFGASDGCGATNLTTPVYSDTRTVPGEVGLGDILRDAGGVPIAGGGGQGYGFTITNGGNATRGIKLGGTSAGYVDAVDLCSGHTTSDWYAGAGTNCLAATFPTQLFNDPSDPYVYVGKKLCTSAGGSLLSPDGFYTLGMSPTGPAVYTVTVSAGIIAAISSYCTTNPIVNAGADQIVSLPSPTINLTGSAFDPDGTISSYAWTQQSGPNSATITTPTLATTGITGVIAGTYVFRLTATDNTSNTGFDDVSITVVSAPLCGDPQLIPMLPRYTWDLSGGSGELSQRINDTTGVRKLPSVLGSGWTLWDRGNADPRHGLFDFNGTQPGVQPDSTSVIMTRSIVHPGNSAGGQTYPSAFHLGNGNQRVFFADFERPIDFDAFYIRTNGVACANAFEIIITDDPVMVRKAVFEWDGYGSPTIDYTVSLTGSVYDSVVNIRKTGRFVIIRFNPNDGNSPKQGPGVTSIFPYGCYNPAAYTRSAITPNYSYVPSRDTTQPVIFNSGKVVATPGSLTSFAYSRLFGGYLNATDTTLVGGGTSDKLNQGWDITNTNFKISLAPYGDPNIFHPSNRPPQELEAYMAITHPNRRLLKQLYNNGTVVNQHVPIDSLGADIRRRQSYGRFVWSYTFYAAILGHNIPNPAAPFTAYLTAGRIQDDWIGGSGFARGVKEWFPPYNENNMDFRPGAIGQSSWMPPVAFYRFHDTLYNVWKSVFPGVPFLMQGLAANGYDYVFIGEMLGKIEHLDDTYTMGDIMNVHKVIVLNLPDINGGCTGNINQQSVFPGLRGNGAYEQAILDTLAMTCGRWRNEFITEYSVASNRNFLLPITGCDCNVLSVPSVPSRPTARPSYIQAYQKLQQQIMLERVRGVVRSTQYEAFDLVDSTSIYYDGNDGSQGDQNVGNSWVKDGHPVSQQHNHLLSGYRVVQILSDSIPSGQYAALYRKTYGGKTDSFCVVTMWQGYVDPSGNRTHYLASDVTTVLHKRHVVPDVTYDGTTVSTPVVLNAVSIPSKFEPDMLFFKSPVLAAQFDTPPTPDIPWRVRARWRQ